MGNKMFEMQKIDIGLLPTAALNGNATGVYYDLADYRKAIAILEVAAMAATFTAKIEVFQATNAAGGSGKLLTGATGTITANTLVTSLKVTLGTVLNTHTLIVNGLTFTAHTDTTDVTIRQFAIDGGTDTLDADELCIVLNDVSGIAKGTKSGIGGSFVNRDRS